MLLGNVTRITWIIATTQFTHIMSQKCRKLQLRALVGGFGSQNAMVGRLDDLGAGVTLESGIVLSGFLL